MRRTYPFLISILLAALVIGLDPRTNTSTRAQVDGPTMLVPNLGVRQVIADLVTPITMAFIGPNDFLVLEKNTGRVKRVVNGAVHSTVLDLAVNFASERGLLGIALHPSFPANPGVYLFLELSGNAAAGWKPILSCGNRMRRHPSARSRYRQRSRRTFIGQQGRQICFERLNTDF